MHSRHETGRSEVETETGEEKELTGKLFDPAVSMTRTRYLYMKSGLYITEIVKRLYQSERMKEQLVPSSYL